jgi:hypothetical protein
MQHHVVCVQSMVWQRWHQQLDLQRQPVDQLQHLADQLVDQLHQLAVQLRRLVDPLVDQQRLVVLLVERLESQQFYQHWQHWNQCFDRFGPRFVQRFDRFGRQLVQADQPGLVVQLGQVDHLVHLVHLDHLNHLDRRCLLCLLCGRLCCKRRRMVRYRLLRQSCRLDFGYRFFGPWRFHSCWWIEIPRSWSLMSLSCCSSCAFLCISGFLVRVFVRIQNCLVGCSS